jgi:bifunctional DNase/RNase
MARIQVEVNGLNSSPHSSGAYALILQEVDGTRRLPIVIGQDQAQSIALELQDVKPIRPVSHDLLKSVIEALGGRVIEVTVTELRDSTFYAVIRIDGASDELDARPSDAIALAIRSGAPIYVEEEVMREAGLQAQEDHEEEMEMEEEESGEADEDDEGVAHGTQPSGTRTRREALQAKLEEAVRNEDYESAILLREELDRLDREE